MLSDAGQNVGEPGLWINIVHLGRDDQGCTTRPTFADAGIDKKLSSRSQNYAAMEGDSRAREGRGQK